MTTKDESDQLPMTAKEKAAWTVLLVSIIATSTVLVLLPYVGNHASSAFALLGAVAVSYWFTHWRRKSIIIDERDREIEKEAERLGVCAAWMFLVISLIVLLLGPGSGVFQFPLDGTTLSWLVWIQFAIYTGTRGLMGVIYYRRQARVS